MSTEITIHAEQLVDGRWVSVETQCSSEQNYLLFNAIAGVRARGFFRNAVGVVEPIARKRGWPDDTTLTVFEGDHNHTWFTGAEVLAWFDLEPHMVSSGIVSLDMFRKWRGGAPEWSAQSVIGHEVNLLYFTIRDCRQYLSNPEHLFQEIIEMYPFTTHVKICWEVPVRESLTEFHQAIQSDIAKYGDTIRYLVSFDS